MKIDVPLQTLYLSWVNDFTTANGFAAHYGLSVADALDIIARGRMQQPSLVPPGLCKIGNLAFWSYDQFPYLLHGVIANVSSDKQAVYIDSYQSWFNPVFCLPPNEGMALTKQLAEIKARCEFVRSSALKDATTAVRALLPEHIRDQCPK
jgi:hypothetical protein